MCVTVLLCCTTATGQAIFVSGTVRDGGKPLQGARITVLDGHGHKIGDLAVSGDDGKYKIVTTRNATILFCLALTDSRREQVTFAKNPVTQPLDVKSQLVTVDFTFIEITTRADYWQSYTRQVDIKGTQSVGSKFPGFVTTEWKTIDTSTLPPDSKAAAAHQFLIMDWSKLIVDRTFRDYSSVDEGTLSRALQGDHTAYVALPASVAKDVATFKSRTTQGPG